MLPWIQLYPTVVDIFYYPPGLGTSSLRRWWGYHVDIHLAILQLIPQLRRAPGAYSTIWVNFHTNMFMVSYWLSQPIRGSLNKRDWDKSVFYIKFDHILYIKLYLNVIYQLWKINYCGPQIPYRIFRCYNHPIYTWGI